MNQPTRDLVIENLYDKVVKMDCKNAFIQSKNHYKAHYMEKFKEYFINKKNL